MLGYSRHGSEPNLHRPIVSLDPMRILVRDFIHRALYDTKLGYFAARNVVGTLMAPLNFRSLLGRPEIESKIAKSMRSLEGNSEAWLTPAEVFAPYFSQGLVAYMVAQYKKREKRAPGQMRRLGKKSKRKKLRGQTPTQEVKPTQPPLRIVEIGAGSGTNAVHMLNHLREAFPNVYRRTEFTIVEISELLAAKQKERLASAGHDSVVNVVIGDACDLEAAGVSIPDGEQARGTCFVVALEVLDNLPHDKAVWAGSTNDLLSNTSEKQQWEEAFVEPQEACGQPSSAGSAKTQSQQQSTTPTNPLGPDPYGTTSPGWAHADLDTVGTHGWAEASRPAADPFLREALELASSPPPPAAVQGSPATPGGDTPPPPGQSKPFAAALSDAVEGAQRALASLLYTAEERSKVGQTGRDVVLVAAQAAGERGGAEVSAGACSLLRTRLPSSGSSTGGEREDGPAWRAAEQRGAQRMQLVEFGGEMGALSASELEPLCLRAELRAAAADTGGPGAVFLPTGALRLFRSLHRALPGHCLIAADFNALPEPDTGRSKSAAAPAAPVDSYIEARNAPIVSTIDASTGANSDHENYLAARPFGCADIFFASDFALLAEAWCLRGLRERETDPRSAGGGGGPVAQVARTRDFLDAHTDLDKMRTVTGYNPAVSMYGNTRILLGRQ